MGAEHRDLTLESVLADPMIRAANKADRISLQDFERLLRATASELRTGEPAFPPPPSAAPDDRRRCIDWSACFA